MRDFRSRLCARRGYSDNLCGAALVQSYSCDDDYAAIQARAREPQLWAHVLHLHERGQLCQTDAKALVAADTEADASTNTEADAAPDASAPADRGRRRSRRSLARRRCLCGNRSLLLARQLTA